MTQHNTTLFPTAKVLPGVSSLQSTYQPNFRQLMRRFAPIQLSQMDDVALLRRTDTKYVMTANQLYVALAALSDEYWVLDVAGTRLNHYQTLYFDTVNFALYQQHHAGSRQRYKVRSRQYVDSSLSFLEVKFKANDHETIKSRLQTAELVTQFSPENRTFVTEHAPLDPYRLEAKLQNDFIRMTLVSKTIPERLTLDVNLQFSHDGQTVVLPGVAIAEVKQEGFNRSSAFVQQMRALNIRPTGFSKYCLGVSMLYPGIKHNNFKPKLRLVHQLMRGHSYVH